MGRKRCMGYDRVEDLRIYQVAEEISERVWELTAKWPFFAKDTIGKQLVRSADSIGANIAEGYGRHHKNDNLRFLFIARGSLQETKVWLSRAVKRRLVAQQEYNTTSLLLERLAPMLNAFISSKVNMGG